MPCEEKFGIFNKKKDNDTTDITDIDIESNHPVNRGRPL